MAMSEGDDVLATATAALRQRAEPGWRSVAAQAKSRAASITNRFEPIAGEGTTGAFTVSDRVLTAQLRRALATMADVRLRAAGFDHVDGRLVRVVLTIESRYGVVLPDRAADVRAAAATFLRTHLGAAVDTVEAIDVTVADLFPPSPPDGRVPPRSGDGGS